MTMETRIMVHVNDTDDEFNQQVLYVSKTISYTTNILRMLFFFLSITTAMNDVDFANTLLCRLIACRN